MSRELEAEDLPVAGAFIIRPKEFYDERGAFNKLYTRELLESKGAGCGFMEEYLSVSKKGVLRGLHYQTGRYAQAKLVRCVRGKILDAFVDMSARSPTFGKSFTVELSAENRLGLYVPRTCAHGFLALEEGAEVLYKSDNDYHPEHEAGLRWDDPKIGIAWPKMSYIISEKDRKWPPFDDAPKFD
ncbi:MAG: dTDP-4-dehydrorhamnose 3,5-epimerase [Candidatus Micrarchaeota archaeon]